MPKQLTESDCVAGSVQPRQLAFALPHAESLTRDNFLEGPANEAGLALIVKFCADRQLSVDEAVVGYLANRIERSYAAARQTVELLDTEALRLGRPVTRALAAELLRNA